MIRLITDPLRHIGGGVFLDDASRDRLAGLVSVDGRRMDLPALIQQASRGGAVRLTGSGPRQKSSA